MWELEKEPELINEPDYGKYVINDYKKASKEYEEKKPGIAIIVSYGIEGLMPCGTYVLDSFEGPSMVLDTKVVFRNIDENCPVSEDRIEITFYKLIDHLGKIGYSNTMKLFDFYKRDIDEYLVARFERVLEECIRDDAKVDLDLDTTSISLDDIGADFYKNGQLMSSNYNLTVLPIAMIQLLGRVKYMDLEKELIREDQKKSYLNNKIDPDKIKNDNRYLYDYINQGIEEQAIMEGYEEDQPVIRL